MGIAIPLLQYSLRALHNYHPAVPEGVPIWKYFHFWNGTFQLRWSISHAVVGFGFLLSTKLGFSMVKPGGGFYLWARVAEGMRSRDSQGGLAVNVVAC